MSAMFKRIQTFIDSSYCASSLTCYSYPLFQGLSSRIQSRMRMLSSPSPSLSMRPFFLILENWDVGIFTGFDTAEQQLRIIYTNTREDLLTRSCFELPGWRLALSVGPEFFTELFTRLSRLTPFTCLIQLSITTIVISGSDDNVENHANVSYIGIAVNAVVLFPKPIMPMLTLRHQLQLSSLSRVPLIPNTFVQLATTNICRYTTLLPLPLSHPLPVYRPPACTTLFQTRFGPLCRSLCTGCTSRQKAFAPGTNGCRMRMSIWQAGRSTRRGRGR
ncbi:hypothetical protein BDP27DRAFT_1401436 [Rhodocollybia butyracea]|uniref:Uncharacterized protein n=1 Tax=Rhodocollybia butyracea TaxID=206335 RepID=A0A9P5U9X1_9AGAR|nr:hypothetical protein BDP27DRAFT_1401436 [Rhodocollybia butyracea]